MSNEAVRDEVLDVLVKNFLGPVGGPQEVISASEMETPMSRYMTGILFPSESAISPQEDDGDLSAESNKTLTEDEARLSACNAPNPSSYGISFACRGDCRLLHVRVACGTYTLEKDAAGVPISWRRTPFAKETDVSVHAERRVEIRALAPGLELRVTSRPPDRQGELPVTVTLVNRHSLRGVPWLEHSRLCFFQCELEVSGRGGASVFVERRSRDTSHLEKELRHSLLLYRHAKLYAVGHGCAADWEPKEAGAPVRVRASFIPVHDVHPLVPPEDLGVPRLALCELALDDVATTTAKFARLASAYDAWIDLRAREVASVPTEFREIAEEQLRACRSSAQRIRRGIASLSNPTVFRAFQLTQRSMLQVFGRSAWQKRNYDPARPPTYGTEHAWRPFQAAFFLQALESLINPQSGDRDVCDLLWFPTGGGKTEAYLALTAMTLFLRRLRSEGSGGGTAVLMRYTLRLLTADQFIRACLMICAAESVRRGESDLEKKAPISIGLWVGDGSTPNKLKEAAESLEALHHGRKLRAGQSSPIKLKRCPWCSRELGVADHRVLRDRNREPVEIQTRCNDQNCAFHGGIPAITVDDQIYAERPSLVLGTIDKFARLPWEARAGAIFSTDYRHEPPDLVIQDELHLISGPLGTIAGLYEAAIDQLCTRNGIRPKLVASTATIRNAESQVLQLFDRRFAQFPQPLLDARDSFFARESHDAPARRFVGLFTPGKTGLTSFIRTAGSLSHAPFGSLASDADKDPYWTLIAYFNSLRELGGAIVRVHDDVAGYLKTCATLLGTAPAFRELEAVEELTSRADQEKLDDVRERLWDRKGEGDPFDMVLCSNMISVGLDVPRLGLMTVVGQPKTTAEYIQATSRIGRTHPGLVVTLYNWTRSRDRSHYEKFIPYHSRLYAEVEATSVTPYSSRARDRALHAVIVSIVRHLVPRLLDNTSAGAFRTSADSVQLQPLRTRIRSILRDPSEQKAAEDHLDRIIAHWEGMGTAAQGTLSYRADPDFALLVPFEDHAPHNPGFPTMNNMRNVDAPAGIYLLT